jgi:hypothetical protein
LRRPDGFHRRAVTFIWRLGSPPADDSGNLDLGRELWPSAIRALPWLAHQDVPRWRNPAGAYHNGAVWPYVGAFHFAALATAGRREDASAMLVEVAAATRLGDGFHEWIHAATGEPSGAASQAWNAGAYLWASELVLADIRPT